MKFLISLSHGKGNKKNTRYGTRRLIGSKEEFLEAVRWDHVCGIFKGDQRGADRFLGADVLMLDCDNEQSEDSEKWVTLEKAKEIFEEFNFALLPSRNHEKEKGGKSARPRWHIYFVIGEQKDAKAYAALKRQIQKAYPFFDPGALDAARMIFGTDAADAIWHEGGTNVDEVFPVRELEMLGENQVERNWDRKEVAAGDPIPVGQRNSTLYHNAVNEFWRSGDGEKVWEMLLDWNARCEQPLGETEIRQIYGSAEKWYCRARKDKEVQCLKLFNKVLEQEETEVKEKEKAAMEEEKKNSVTEKEDNGAAKAIPISCGGRKKRAATAAGSQSAKFMPEDFSDMGQAKVLANKYRKILCFSDATGYLRYNGTVWEEGSQSGKGAVEKLLDHQLKEAEEMYMTAREKLLEAGIGEEIIDAGGKELAAAGKEKGLREFLKEFGRMKTYKTYISKHRENRNVDAVAAAAKPMLLFDPRELDHDPFLLNTPDGTYDLREGVDSKKEHDPDDKITKMTACSPGDEGKQLWEEALDKFFCGNTELIAYVQKVIGLAAIGKVFSEHIIIAYGGGANGKSTFCNAIARTLGSYSRRMAADLLTTSAARNARPELAELRGARLVLASELEEGKRMNTAMLKQLASTDDISAEKKYRDPMNFTPSHSLILQTNHLPKVGASDDGTWRRIIVIPFNAQIQAGDDIKNYSDYLAEHAGPYILKWIMEGAKNVIGAGFDIPVPDCVKAATDAYREENDWMKHFLEECCEMDPSYTERSGALYQSYRAYSDQVGEYTRNKGDFYAALEKAGFERKRTSAGVVVYGLKLKNNTGFLG